MKTTDAMKKTLTTVLSAGAVAVLVTAASVAFAADPYAASEKGSCPENPIVLTMSPTVQTNSVKLTPAFSIDEETGKGTTDPTNLVCYYKFKLSRGKAYSLWMTGPDGYQPDPAMIGFYEIEPYPAEGEDDFEPGAMFQEITGKWKPGSMQVMTEDEWYIDEDDPELSDPTSWDYYAHVSGTNDATVTLHYQQANALPKGIEDNPLEIAPGTKSDLRETVTFVDGEYTYAFEVSPFLANHRYLFATEGGTSENPYSLGFGTPGKLTPYAPWASDYNVAWTFDPDSTGAGTAIAAETLADPEAEVTIRYQLLPTRQLKDHDPETLPLGAEGVRFVPGRINATGNQFYDAIIDQRLFKTVQLTAGRRYVVETNGSKTNLLMRIYGSTYDPEFEALSEKQQANKTGSPKYTGKPKGDGSYDLRCGFQADVTGVYYIGVCQDLADDDLDEPLADNEIRLTIEEVKTTPGAPDVWDDADDAYTGATMLTPVRGIKWVQPAQLDEAGSEWHQLGKFDWYDVYALPVRAGLGYGVSVTFESDSETEFAADVFLMNGKSESRVKATGDINPGSDSGLFFAAAKNGMYYVRIRTAGTYGLDCPRYKVHTIVYNDEEQNSDHVGLLHVDAKGCPAATWTLGSESMKYPLGTTIALPIATNRAETTATVKFGAEKNFVVSPTSMSVKLVASDEPARAFAVYSDKYDPKDNVESGAFSWSLSNKEKTESRTLWTDDDADYFALTGKDGYSYDIVMNQSEGGDAVFSILHDGETLCAGVTNVHQFVLPTAKTKYYLKVQHQVPANPKDASYSLSGFYANVGAIKFAKAEYKVKEGVASVSIAVNRTAKEGKVRVRLRTVDGAYAKGIVRGDAGDDDSKFYKKDLILEWANGDNKAKNVTIDLIPDLRPLFHDVTRAFTVELVDAKDGDDSFYPASFVGGGDKAVTTVILTEVAKKAPGTVQVANSDNKNPKKPEFTVTAGSDLKIVFDRTVGSYGDISVVCDTSALDGKAPNLLWKAGIADPQELSVQVPEAKDRKASAKYTIKLKANTGSGLEKATLAASSITVYALNQQFAQTLADYTKKTLSKTAGYTVKEGKSGTWFVDENGDFVNFEGSSALTLTVTGPAVLQYRVDDGELLEFSSAVPGKTATLTIPAGAKKVSDVRYVFAGGGYETVYQAVRYGYDEPISAETTAKLKVSVGKLPDGVKLEQDKASKAWYVRGVPTKAGYFFAEIQDAQKKVVGTNAFEVIALRSVVGTFSGVAKAEIDGAAALAQVTFTAAATGKLSAKASVNGKSYSLAATGFVCADTNETPVRLDAELLQVQKGVTNKLTCTLTDYELADPDGWGDLPSCQLTMGGTPDTVYDGFLCRDNSKVTEWVTEMAGFAGYYTVSLVPGDDKLGNGYLTLTLDAKGKIKIAGVRADGVSFSASSIVGGLDLTSGDPAVFVPVFAFKKPAVVGGWMAIRFPADGEPVTDVPKGAFFRWAGEDVSQTLETVGGYYDTVVNLQRAYLTDAFSLSAVDVAVDVTGNTVNVPKGNAANVKLTFKRATGVLTGTSDLEYDGKAYKNLKHAGILILNRSTTNAAALGEEVWAAGSLVIPKVTNVPFNVLRDQYED